MDLSTFDQFEQETLKDLVIEEESLYKEFEKVKDGRKEKGKRYPLPFVLTLLMLGKMAGQKTISGVRDWVREREKDLKKRLDWPKDFPVHSTYTNALAHCDDEDILRAIKSVITKARAKEKCAEEPSRLQTYKEEGEQLTHTAMDGKTMRGTGKHVAKDQPSVHLLALYEPDTGIVIDQETVKEKENEITASDAFLDPLYVKGRIISTDAMHTQRKWCAGVHACGGYYHVNVKKNQKTVYQDLKDYFDDKENDGGEWEYHIKSQKGHGRLEVREIWTSTQMNEWFETEWAGVAQVFKIRRRSKRGDKECEEIVYGFTNLSRKQVNAEQNLLLNQKHWCIENRFHYRRDVTLGEDASQVRIQGAPSVLAAINTGILAIMDFLDVKNVASKMRHFDAHYEEVLPLLFGTLSR